MDLFLAISQGIGVSAASGIRVFLPALLVGLLARANLGVDFNHTDFSFLESVWWLAVLVAGVALTVLARRRRIDLPVFVPAVLAVGIGALEFAGTLADDGYAAGAGLAAGAACALIGFAAARAFFDRAAARVRAVSRSESASFIELYAEVAALAAAGLAVLLPPSSYLVLAFCAWVLFVSRRRSAAKYEGLRVLR
jgi:Domain of unknown function (DUF4126)